MSAAIDPGEPSLRWHRGTTRSEASATVEAQTINRIKAARKAAGWSAQRLADEVAASGFHLHRATIANWEAYRGLGSLRLTQVWAIAAVLGIRPADLLGIGPNPADARQLRAAAAALNVWADSISPQ